MFDNLVRRLKKARYPYVVKKDISIPAIIDWRDRHTDVSAWKRNVDGLRLAAKMSLAYKFRGVQLRLLREALSQARSKQRNDKRFTDILFPETTRMNRFTEGDLTACYRYYEKDGKKPRPAGFSKPGSFKAFEEIFKNTPLYVFLDNSSDEARDQLQALAPHAQIFPVRLGNAGNLLKALEFAATLPDNRIVYFVEDDYRHLPGSKEVILEGFNSGIPFDYLTLYDHPDKYIDGYNKDVKDGGEVSRVFFSGSVHWKETNSTTMTFAATAGTIKKDIDVFRRFCSATIPNDYRIFNHLRKSRNRRIISSIPGYSSHCDVEMAAPLFYDRYK